MIITIIFLGMILLGLISIRLSDKHYNALLEGFGIGSLVLGTIISIILIIVIIASHVAAPKTIQENKLNYDSLCKRYEIIASEYEDVSKSDVISDITAWNIEVYNIKYWTYNPWTSWFNPKEIADNLNYISLEKEDKE